MPNIPSVGAFIPNGYLNLGSFAGPSGQRDAYGLDYPSGLTPGKMVQLGTAEAAVVAAPGTALYDGTYQAVLLDSGATAALATQGYAAYVKMDSGAVQGALPMTEYDNLTVTTADVAGANNLFLFAGIFVNPATVGGVANTPTANQYCFIFTGGGRAVTKYSSSGATLGQQVVPDGAATGEFTSRAAGASVYPSGIALQTVTGVGSSGVSLWQEIIYRVGNQGV